MLLPRICIRGVPFRVWRLGADLYPYALHRGTTQQWQNGQT
jgi:hypothetical protein